MSNWWDYIPQQWVGLVALLMFAFSLVTQFVEKYPAFAKAIPLGRWWHERQKHRIRDARIAEYDDEAVQALQRRVESIARTSAKQAQDIKSLQATVSAFTAWSVYDARWHHRDAVKAVDEDRQPPQHYDFFAFERIWRDDPVAAAQLSLIESPEG